MLKISSSLQKKVNNVVFEEAVRKKAIIKKVKQRSFKVCKKSYEIFCFGLLILAMKSSNYECAP